ncbi:hypothetical protein Scep_027902 [Stephania cephalantha]|uniref:Uncharacterized protein n=1 Tax=Stephania cephalantha TaxID=152367 RepID=A0AAP0EB47_9MAGN
MSYMARSKAIVTSEKTSSKPLGSARGRGGRRPHATSYQKEKQKIEIKVNAPATSIHALKCVLQDEGSHVAKHQERDLMIACNGSQGEASESSEDSLRNEEREEGHMGGSSTGGGNRGTRATRGTQGGRGGHGTRPITNEEEQ